ncbi:MAG: AAA family ATPase [Desulfovibrionaceae bacterium]
MHDTRPVAVTIARQFGSGGAALGARLAQRLGFVFIDRQILSRAANALGVDEDAVAVREERVATFWQGLLDSFARGVPDDVFSPQPQLIPTEQGLFAAQQQALRELAACGDCVVVGRGGFKALAGVARCVNVFLHASEAYRVARLEQDGRADNRAVALDMILKADAERARYIREVTSAQWHDARNYDLCLDMGRLDRDGRGMDAALAVIERVVRAIAGPDKPI